MNLGGGVIKINKCAIIVLTFIFLFIIYVFTSSNTTSIDAISKRQHHNKVNLRKLVIGLISAAKLGGEQIIKVAKNPDFDIKSKGKTKEGLNDFLTDADVNSHCSIAYSLWRIFPKLQLISEEDVEEKTCTTTDADSFDLDPSVLGNVQLPDINVSPDDITLWIDPLDATKEFTEKLFQYVSVMICVADRKTGEPFIGVVYFPFSKKTYWAWKGHGMSENLSGVKVDLGEVVQNPIAIFSMSHAGEVKSLIKDTLGERVSIIQAAGSGFKIVQVLEGNATIYLHQTRIKKWDLCAGNALVNAVGGNMVTLKREKISYQPDSNHVVEDGLLVELYKNVMNLKTRK